jgi:hypothetical protein
MILGIRERRGLLDVGHDRVPLVIDPHLVRNREIQEGPKSVYGSGLIWQSELWLSLYGQHWARDFPHGKRCLQPTLPNTRE